MPTDADFLSFKDFISSKEHLNKDWITVARLDDLGKATPFGTFSVLVPNNERMIRKVLKNSEWEVHMNFGFPYFSMSPPSKDVKFHVGNITRVDRVVFHAFTFVREFHGAFPTRIEIDQSFIFYHGLYFDHQNQKYIEPVSDTVVIEYENLTHAKIKTSYLKDYLAARKMVLLRYHDHRRFVKKPLELTIKKELDFVVNDNLRNFHIFADKGCVNGEITISRLLGKDIILPFKEPTHPDFLWLARKEEKKYVNFIIGVDTEGKNIEETCNEKELGNFFSNTGKPHFLTLTFFKKEVLQKYYQNPRRYTVSVGYLRCLDIWGIPFDINEAGLVHVWLGDLGRLPYEEQLHFRQYNVPPSGGISKEFYQAQIMAQFVEKREPISDFKKLFEEVNELSQEKLGFKLFHELTDEDAHVYKTVHVPTTNELRELDEQLIYLSKILNDSINKSDLKKRIK